jgi:hypothetical protein
MGRAIEWAQMRTAEDGGPFLIVNTGSNDWNYSVRELAVCVSEYYGDVEIEFNEAAPPDNRSYRVDFSLFRELAGQYYPTRTIQDSIADIDVSLSRCALPLDDFRNGNLIRLNLLRRMVEEGALNRDIRWAAD